MPDMTKQMDTPAGLSGIVNIIYLNRDNCEITEKNGFIGLKAVVDKPTAGRLRRKRRTRSRQTNPTKRTGRKKKRSRRKKRSRSVF